MFFQLERLGKLDREVVYLTLGYVNTYPHLNLFNLMTSHSKGKTVDNILNINEISNVHQWHTSTSGVLQGRQQMFET